MDGFQSDIVPEPSEELQKPRSGFLHFIIDVLETVALAVLLFVGINAISARIRVDGYSMEPTLQSGEFVFVNKLTYKFGSPQTGDVIVFRYPRDPEQEYIKRVIGTPGDHILIRNGQVYINDQPLQEPYIAAPPAYVSEWKVPEDQLFVLGDNRNNSSDSHNWGPVPMEYVIGKAVFIYWPLREWGPIASLTNVLTAPAS